MNLKKFISNKVGYTLLILFFSLLTFAQSQPYLSQKSFASTVLVPTNSNLQDALNNYTIWKTNFTESCGNGQIRVKFDTNSQTVSEGIGYGMLLAAYAHDQSLFDGLWNYYKSNRNANGVMNWKINGCSGILGQNGASDAELDAAMALIVADSNWGSPSVTKYKSDAAALITIVKTHEIESGTNILKPGDMFGGSSLTNPSYFATGYFRAFANFMNDPYWNTVANKCYTVINNNLQVNNAVGGIVSDWCDSSGNYTSNGYLNSGKTYSYDAARTPWRIAVDFAWFQNSQAKEYSKKSSDFVRINLGGSANIVDGYNQNGTKVGRYHNPTFVGGFACAAMGGDNQVHLNNSYTDLKNLNEPNSYFNQTLKTLYLFLLNSSFYLPDNASGNTNTPINTSPTAAITSPNNGAVFTSGANIAITASATDNGSITQVAFYKGTTLLGTDTSSPYQYTISNASVGTYSLKVIATDNEGATTSSSIVNVTVNAVVTPPSSGGNCNFGTPSTGNLSSFDRITFNKMYKIGTGGPNLSNFKNFKINWNAATKSLAQFAYSTNDGVPGYYVDLRTTISQSFSSSSPAVKIIGSGITGLDGNYWVNKHGLNLALVSKDGNYTLYFSNDNVTPSCNTAKKVIDEKLLKAEAETSNITVYPNPSNGVVNIDGIQLGTNLIISNMQGETVYQKKAAGDSKKIDISYLPNGFYILTIDSKENTKKLKIIISK
ncbi:glycosyl hydrolase family 8 [Flavobacterium sp. PL002]|uniref:glycosyl hydrolase family 8 n=1 Tax=Flavobacterium sp. PL002 TaxID=1897058 RepID=UPI0017878EC7|nr:glycosyl hydrolase family 8 [Flavobacterium sp. PL002]MBE0390206.1 Endoglucanase A [Flavobacterium sp. PL002]